MGSTNGFLEDVGPTGETYRGPARWYQETPVGCYQCTPVGWNVPQVSGKAALGQQLGIPSLLCQLEAGRAFLQGCKAVGDPFPLWVILVLDICIKLLSRTAAASPHPLKALPALPRHRGTPSLLVPGNLQMEFFRGTFCTWRSCFGK